MRASTPGFGHSILLGLLLAAGAATPLAAQSTEEPLTLSTDHPRLFLRPARLRLLRRERERASPRWQQLEALVAGNAPLPERGFALALYYQIAGEATAGRQAIAWALGPGRDLRQLALVFDWCQDLLSDAQRRDLTARIEQGMRDTASDEGIPAMRSRILAAVALFDHAPQSPRRELERARNWWNGTICPGLASGRSRIVRADAYPLFELLHAMRDNTLVDLRETCPRFFKDFSIEHLLSYYPAPYQGKENDFYIGAAREPGGPDLQAAAFSRAAGLAMVAYDTNAPATQVLQGWLMHDRFILRGTLGAPYEFLWANPYHPGLTHEHVPPFFHNPDLGRLFVRSSWDETARWFGYFDGVAQKFEDGRVSVVDPRSAAPVRFEAAVVCFGRSARKFRLKLAAPTPVFLVGLEPHRTYQVEVDDEEMYEAATDPGGILELDLAGGREVGVRVREAGQAGTATAPGTGQ
jgi:hypothetical protein